MPNVWAMMSAVSLWMKEPSAKAQAKAQAKHIVCLRDI